MRTVEPPYESAAFIAANPSASVKPPSNASRHMTRRAVEVSYTANNGNRDIQGRVASNQRKDRIPFFKYTANWFQGDLQFFQPIQVGAAIDMMVGYFLWTIPTPEIISEIEIFKNISKWILGSAIGDIPTNFQWASAVPFVEVFVLDLFSSETDWLLYGSVTT